MLYSVVIALLLATAYAVSLDDVANGLTATAVTRDESWYGLETSGTLWVIASDGSQVAGLSWPQGAFSTISALPCTSSQLSACTAFSTKSMTPSTDAVLLLPPEPYKLTTAGVEWLDLAARHYLTSAAQTRATSDSSLAHTVGIAGMAELIHPGHIDGVVLASPAGTPFSQYAVGVPSLTGFPDSALLLTVTTWQAWLATSPSDLSWASAWAAATTAKWQLVGANIPQQWPLHCTDSAACSDVALPWILRRLPLSVARVSAGGAIDGQLLWELESRLNAAALHIAALDGGLPVMAVSNGGYADLVKSWSCNLAAAGGKLPLLEQLVITCTDAACVTAAAAAPMMQRVVVQPMNEVQHTETLAASALSGVKASEVADVLRTQTDVDIGTPKYIALMYQRMALQVMATRCGAPYMLAEADFVWFKHAPQVLMSEYGWEGTGKAPTWDTIWYNDAPPKGNGGVGGALMIFRATEAAQRLGDAALSTLKQRLGNIMRNALQRLKGSSVVDMADQAVWQEKVPPLIGSGSAKVLPTKTWVYGRWYEGKKPESWKADDMVLLHNNYIIGKSTKVKRFKQFGQWFIDEAGTKCVMPKGAAVHYPAAFLDLHTPEPAGSTPRATVRTAELESKPAAPSRSPSTPDSGPLPSTGGLTLPLTLRQGNAASSSGSLVYGQVVLSFMVLGGLIVALLWRSRGAVLGSTASSSRR